MSHFAVSPSRPGPRERVLHVALFPVSAQHFNHLSIHRDRGHCSCLRGMWYFSGILCGIVLFASLRHVRHERM